MCVPTEAIASFVGLPTHCPLLPVSKTGHGEALDRGNEAAVAISVEV